MKRKSLINVFCIVLCLALSTMAFAADIGFNKISDPGGEVQSSMLSSNSPDSNGPVAIVYDAYTSYTDEWGPDTYLAEFCVDQLVYHFITFRVTEPTTVTATWNIYNLSGVCEPISYSTDFDQYVFTPDGWWYVWWSTPTCPVLNYYQGIVVPTGSTASWISQETCRYLVIPCTK